MSIDIPPPLRAAAGLAARTYDEARALPNRLVSLPVLAVGAALQVSMRVQQQYAELVARGDELISALRGNSSDAPPWATFDEDLPPQSSAHPGFARSAFDLALDPAESATTTAPEPVSTEPEPSAAPVPGYDSWTIAQLRARLRRLSSAELADLLRYEEGARARAAYLTMLENRLAGPRPRR